MYAFVWAALALATDVGPTSAFGGPTCALGPEQVVADAAEPSGPFGVVTGVGAQHGLLIWQDDARNRPVVVPITREGARRGEAVPLGFEVSHLVGVVPLGERFLFVGWGFSSLCKDGCVVAQGLDASGSPVGAPAVWESERLQVSFDAVTAGSRVVLAATDTAGGTAAWIEATLGKDGSARVEATPLDVRLAHTGRYPVITAAGDSAAMLLPEAEGYAWVVDGALRGRTGATEADFGYLTREGKRWTAWSRGEDAAAHPIDAAGQLGTPRPAQKEEMPYVRVRMDVGGGEDALGNRVSGLLLERGDVLVRSWPTHVSVAQPRRPAVARSVEVVGDQLLVSYVIADEAGAWRAITRTVRCPAP
jgi:hypothetical protein